MIEIRKFNISDAPDLARKSLEIRREVFVLEQNVDPDVEYEYEEESVHYLLLDNGNPVSTARWRLTPEGIKLERFATMPDERGKGYGTRLLRTILTDVLSDKKKIYLHSQVISTGFYEKYGFVKTGQSFTEAGLEHFMMIYLP